MSGKEIAMLAVEMQRKYPQYLSVRWTRVVETILADGRLTINEAARMLNLNTNEMKKLGISMHRLKYVGRVRKYGIRFELTGKTTRYYKQRNLEEFFH